jgi:hypothetical protein
MRGKQGSMETETEELHLQMKNLQETMERNMKELANMECKKTEDTEKDTG